MFCPNCGNKVPDGNNFCVNCGKPVSDNVPVPVQNSPKTGEESNKTANILCIISLVLMFAAGIPIAIIGAILPVLKPLAETLGAFSPLTAIVLMIIARVKYPKSGFAKVVMWIYIALIAIFLLAIILLYFFCYMACRGYNPAG